MQIYSDHTKMLQNISAFLKAMFLLLLAIIGAASGMAFEISTILKAMSLLLLAILGGASGKAEIEGGKDAGVPAAHQNAASSRPCKAMGCHSPSLLCYVFLISVDGFKFIDV